MRARRLFVVSLAALAVLHLCYGLKRLTLGLDFTDEGAYLAWPLRMLFGEKPFAGDVTTLLRPLSAYLSAVFEIYPGITLYEFRLLGWSLHLVSFCVLSAYLFRISRAALLSPLVASVPFYACHILGLATPSYNSISSDFLLMALALRGLAEDGTARRQVWLNVASGFALFVATLAHPGLGLVGAVIVLREFVWGGLAQNAFRRRLSPSNLGAVVFVAGWLAFIGYLAATGALEIWLHRVALFQSFSVRSIRTSPVRFYLLLLGYPFLIGRLAQIFSVAAFVAGCVLLFSRRPNHRPRASAAAAALALFALVSLICVFSYNPGHLPIAFAQAAVFLLGVHCLGLTGPLLPPNPSARFLLFLSLLGALTYATVSYYFSPFRSWLSGILALPFAFATGLTLLLNVDPGRFRALFRTLATAMLVLAVACVAREHYRSVYRDSAPPELQSVFRVPKLNHIRSTPERVHAVDALYDYLHPRIQRGEALLAFDNCPILYYLLDAKPAYGMAFAVRYTQSRAALEQLDREFRAQPLPRYAIRTLVNPAEAVWHTASRTNYDDYPLNETLVANYQLEQTIFPFQIWRLKGDGS
jgi:hypothetical protein